MKIVIDARLYGLENAGPGRYTQNLIRELAELDMENNYVLLVTSKYFNQLNLPPNFSYALADFKHYSFREQLELIKIIKQIRPDVTHFLHFNVPVAFRGKFVVTIHDLLMHRQKGLDATTLNPVMYYVKRLGYKTVFARAVKGSAKIIVPTTFVKADILKHYRVDAQKIHVIYEGVDMVESQALSREKVLTKYGLTGKYFLYVGSVYPHKNLSRVIEAAASVRTTLAIVCARSVFKERLEKLVREKNAQDYVKFLGFVPDAELRVLYQNSTAYVFASLMEGFGLPGLEAMAAGTVVVASNIPVFKEVYSKAAVYFNPYDFSDIAKKMELVLDMSDHRRQEIIAEGKKLAASYSWKKMAEETLMVYKLVV